MPDTKTYKYIVKFHGREIGAIGTVQSFTRTIFAENAPAVRSELYKNFEHISNYRVLTLREMEGL